MAEDKTYIQQSVEKDIQDQKKEKHEDRVLTKPGEYDGVDLEKAAKIYSGIGGKY
tara:strand:- start:1365 stop:1529 length:165 start_codon:yes stop_codon:yes gene_type:complete